MNMLMILDVVGKSIVEILVMDKCDVSTTSGCVDFLDKLKKFFVECGLDLKYLKNDKNRISDECSRKEFDGCLWHVYASNCDMNDFFVIPNRMLVTKRLCYFLNHWNRMLIIFKLDHTIYQTELENYIFYQSEPQN
ncbi:hypothetical protein DVH24_039321 [Malus domestica]|uniref:Transposase MuDR plant domain-containing protein n=1 Tax=Malus domestica TaxID=3750 RepID=A0A498I070_MALDO|nr:hypothetical protein DVH24_039321 [Malus domestica]